METIGEDLQAMPRRLLVESHVDAIRAIASECSYAAGDMVAEVGAPMDRFVLVVDGEIEVVDPYRVNACSMPRWVRDSSWVSLSS